MILFLLTDRKARLAGMYKELLQDQELDSHLSPSTRDTHLELTRRVKAALNQKAKLL